MACRPSRPLLAWLLFVLLTPAALSSGGGGPIKNSGTETDCLATGAAATTTNKHAYMVMIGPFTVSRKYKKWLYAAVALRSALVQHGSTADMVVLCALRQENNHKAAYLLPEEEDLLRRHDIFWRYVRAPYGNPGFHMGHYKLWAWQHTEYEAIQLLDADLMPLVNMDQFFDVNSVIDSAFVGCPGKLSVLNAGWFVLKPSCGHFFEMTEMLHDQMTGTKWDKVKGWGHELPYWLSASNKVMRPGWDFFDARGNQGHMYNYFLFEAKDLTLIYEKKVLHHRNGSLDGVDLLTATDPMTSHMLDEQGRATIKNMMQTAYPCPFPIKPKGVLSGNANRAYHHFTGNVKPWSQYKPQNPQFKLWYDALASGGDVDIQRDLFGPEPEVLAE